MSIGSISNISFRQASPFPMERNQGYFMPMPQTASTGEQVSQQTPQVIVVKETAEPQEEKKKKGGLRNAIAKVAKFFTTASEMTKATAKALWYGTATGGATLATFWALGALPRQMKNKELKRAFVEPLKTISTKGKVVAAVAALAVASIHIIKGVLRSNQRAANVEHQLDVEHVTH